MVPLSHTPVGPTPEEIAAIREQLAQLPTKGTLIYQSRNQRIHRFQLDSLDLIAKTFLLKSPAQRFASFFRHSRAQRSHRASVRFHRAGILTPRPFLMEKNHPLVPTKITLVSEFCPHPALLDSINNGEPVHPTTPEKILTLLHQLAATRCSHGDFHGRNLLVDPEGTPHLIDLDGVRYHPLTVSVTRSIRNDRDRLLRSLKPLPEHYQKFSSILGQTGSPLPSPAHD